MRRKFGTSLVKDVGDYRSCRLRRSVKTDPESRTDVLNRPGRVGTKESATCPSLALASCVTTLLVYVSTGADEGRNRGGPHETFEAWREHIPVSKNVNWNHCYKVVAALLTLVQWKTSQHHAQRTHKEDAIVSAHRRSPWKR